MSDLTPEQQYKKEYDEATAALDAAEQGNQPEATTALAKEPEKAVEAKPEAKPVEAQAKPEDKQPETVEEWRAKAEKAEKQARDNQAWGTKQAQELAALKREREQREREATKPAILDDNPELAEAIRHVVNDPAPKIAAQERQEQWQATIEAAHPGIFDPAIDPQLESAIADRLKALGEDVHNPLNVIREIAAEKEAFAVRKATERFAAEHAKQEEKSAMSVPTPGGGGQQRQAPDADADAAKRILNMSEADFEKEVRRVKGY